MKKIYLLITILFIANILYAQTDGISYQAVILNPNQQELPGVNAKAGILPNKNISLRFTIINQDGSDDYSERHFVTTDAFGMVNLFIGDGEQLSATGFVEINWDGTAKTLQVDIDFDGGNNYVPLSNQKLTFVPFAAHRDIRATGTLTVDGLVRFNNDFAIEGETSFNSDLTINGKTSIEDDLTVNGLANLNNNLNVNNSSTTNLSGTLNVEGATTVDNRFTVAGQTQLNNNVNIGGTTNIEDTLNVNGISNLENQLIVAGSTEFNNNVLITGTTTLQDTLSVGGLTSLSSRLTVAGQTQVNNNMFVAGATKIGDTLTVDGVTNLNQALTISNSSPVNLTGTINIEGIATLNDNLTVNGNSELSNLVVSGAGTIDGGHIALFENTAGGEADGIAIRIDKGTLGFRNRFITFYGEGNYMAGRIESFDLFGGDTFESFPVPDFANLFDVFDFNNVLTGGALPSLVFNGGSLPSASLNRGSLPSWHSDGTHQELHRGSLPSLSFNRGSLPSTNFNIGSFPTLNFDGFFDPQAGIGASTDIGNMVGWGMRNGDPGFIPTSPFKLAMVPLILAAKQLAMNQGVIYGSKGADYAEWLEKENPDEKFVFGEVVGVKGGKISKTTEGADHVLTISLAPIVLGNMPDEDRKEDFEKVGFMGQLPVLVLGDVSVGDYIVASGYNDGYAKAISPEQIELKDLKNVIGKAWSSSDGAKVSLINVSVGLKTNEWVDIFNQQEKRLNELESKLNNFQTLSDRLNRLEGLVQHLSAN